MHEDFHRIKRLPPYVFAEVNRLKAAARARGADIIDLGMGNPDLPTPQHIVDKMVETIAKPRTHRRIVRQLRQRAGQLVAVAGIDQQAADAIAHDFRDARHPRRHHGHSGAHRQHHRKRQSFPERRHREDVDRAQNVAEIAARAEKMHARAEAQRLGTRAQIAGQLAVAHHDQMH